MTLSAARLRLANVFRSMTLRQARCKLSETCYDVFDPTWDAEWTAAQMVVAQESEAASSPNFRGSNLTVHFTRGEATLRPAISGRLAGGLYPMAKSAVQVLDAGSLKARYASRASFKDGGLSC